MKTKLKGFLEFQGVLLAILLGFVALSFLQISSGQFAALAASRKALQAQQFAQSEADYLRNVSYDQLSSAAHGKKAISGANGWMSSVSIGSETTVNDVKQRIGTIQVYRNNTVASPDFSLQVPLSSSGGGDSLPIGTILPYVGDIKDIPTKWALCDGSNGTPDLTGRFLEGVTKNPKEFKDAGLPNATGQIASWNARAPYNGFQSGVIKSTMEARANFHYSEGNNYQEFWGYLNIDLSRSSKIYGKSNTVQPASYTVMYIMKIQA